MLVTLASGDIGEEEPRATPKTTVVEHVESLELPFDAQISPQPPPNKFMILNSIDTDWLITFCATSCSRTSSE